MTARYSVATSHAVVIRDDGTYVVVRPGDRLLSSDPIVKSNLSLFDHDAPDQPVRRVAPRRKE